MFHCGLPGGPIHSATFTLTGVYKALEKCILTAFLYNFVVALLVMGSFCIAVILGLKVFDNSVLRRIFYLHRLAVTALCRKL